MVHLNHQDRLLLGKSHAFQIFVPAQAVQHQAVHAVAVESRRWGAVAGGRERDGKRRQAGAWDLGFVPATSYL